ncbi:unnamed protein product [Leptidea sinapis]|uniref:Tetraspanin n=1 Tax=Leptidea sinapis TaxID=189913 RepID=A0A5E4R5B6_9NEOP|nr:unnamed protein product [Leptidea sinapis]
MDYSVSRVPELRDTGVRNAPYEEEALTFQLGLAAAMLAIFFFFISFMGLYGAIARSPFLLFMYAVLILLLLLLECALVYYFTSSVLEKGVEEQDGQLAHAIRLSLHCCDYNDTIPLNTNIPWSCCGTNGYPRNCTTDRVYGKNCKQQMYSWLKRYQTLVYGSLAGLHILLSSCSLLRRASSASRSYT